MKETPITLPELGLVAATRAALGAGLGLLLADRLSLEQRRAVGWTLLLVGAATTIPLAFEILGKVRTSVPARAIEQTTDGRRSEFNDRLSRRHGPEERIGYSE